MTGYLLDTCVISGIRVRRPNRGAVEWLAGQEPSELHLSCLTIGELKQGAVMAGRHSAERQAELEAWLSDVILAYGRRVLPIDRGIALRWGEMATRRTVAVFDGLMAATALVYDLTLVTRNTHDVEGLGLRVLNPFS